MAQTGKEQHHCVVTKVRLVCVGERKRVERDREYDEREREGGRDYTIAAHKANSCVGNVL